MPYLVIPRGLHTAGTAWIFSFFSSTGKIVGKRKKAADRVKKDIPDMIRNVEIYFAQSPIYEIITPGGSGKDVDSGYMAPGNINLAYENSAMPDVSPKTPQDIKEADHHFTM